MSFLGGESVDRNANSAASAEQVVRTVAAEAAGLESSVNKLPSISKTSKEYRYYEEMLERLILRLDGVDTCGSEQVRTLRKDVIKSIQIILDRLERKAA